MWRKNIHLLHCDALAGLVWDLGPPGHSLGRCFLDILRSCARIAYLKKLECWFFEIVESIFIKIQEFMMYQHSGIMRQYHPKNCNRELWSHRIVKSHARYRLRMMRMKQTSKRLLPQEIDSLHFEWCSLVGNVGQLDIFWHCTWSTCGMIMWAFSNFANLSIQTCQKQQE